MKFYQFRQPPYEEEAQLIEILKTHLSTPDDKVLIQTLFDEFGTEHLGTMAGIDYLIHEFLNGNFLCLHYDIRYVTLSSFGIIHLGLIKYEKPERYYDKMTYAEYFNAVCTSCLTDYDGHGFYGNETHVSNVPAVTHHSGSDLRLYQETFSHVYWCNK